MINTKCSTHKQDMKYLMRGHKRKVLLERGAVRSLSDPQIKFHLIDPQTLHRFALCCRICNVERTSREHRGRKKGLAPAGLCEVHVQIRNSQLAFEIKVSFISNFFYDSFIPISTFCPQRSLTVGDPFKLE